MQNIMNDPLYQQAIIKRKSIRPSQWASPSLGDIGTEFGKAHARRGLDSARAGGDMGIGRRRLLSSLKLGELALDDKRVGYDREYKLAMDWMGEAKRQNRIGTQAAWANLGVSGLSAYSRALEADKILSWQNQIKRLRQEQNDPRMYQYIDFLEGLLLFPSSYENKEDEE